MKRFLGTMFLVFALIGVSSAQGLFDNFWHPRPPIAKSHMTLFGATATSSTIYEFKPAITVNAFSLSPGLNSGDAWVSGVVNGAGPGLSLVNTTQNDDGNGNVTNYVNYSLTASVIFGGTFKNAPVIGTSGELMVGFLNNLLSVGAKYDFYTPLDRKPWAILIGVQFMPTLN